MRTSNELNTPYLQYITYVYGNTVWQCGKENYKNRKIRYGYILIHKNSSTVSYCIRVPGTFVYRKFLKLKCVAGTGSLVCGV